MNGIPGRPDLCRAASDIQRKCRVPGKMQFRPLVIGLVPYGGGGRRNAPARSQAPMVWLEGLADS